MRNNHNVSLSNHAPAKPDKILPDYGSYDVNSLHSSSTSESSSSIQQSFTDSSNEESVGEFSKNFQLMLPDHQNGLILPPLPSAAFQNQPILPRGPNPYALQPTTQHNVYHHHQHPYEVPFERKALKTSIEQDTIVDHNENPLHLEQKVNQGPSFDYRAERLAKQRQSVEGGSLFCTSPRSFLMGKKTDMKRPSGGFMRAVFVTALVQHVVRFVEQGVELAAAVLGAGGADADLELHRLLAVLDLDGGGQGLQPLGHVQGVVVA